MRTTPLVAVCLLAAVAACQGDTVTSPDRLAPDDLVQAKKGKVIHRASGGGQLDYDIVDENGDPVYVGMERYGFSAVLHEDGSASGQLETYWGPDNLRMHGEIVCLAVDGNEAGMIARITGGDTDIYPEGFLWLFKVADNGEGKNALPDQLSAFYPWLSTDDCPAILRADVGMYDWTRGNVQVK